MTQLENSKGDKIYRAETWIRDTRFYTEARTPEEADRKLKNLFAHLLIETEKNKLKKNKPLILPNENN